MKKSLLSVIVLVVVVFLGVNAQNITITDDDSHIADESSILDLFSKSKGFLIPRMTGTEISAIEDPSPGLMVFNTTVNGFSYYNGSNWELIYDEGNNIWQVTGDSVYLEETLYNVGIGTTSPTSKLTIEGYNGYPTDNPLFEVKNNDGQTVFAVYQQGVRCYVGNDLPKGSPGGFAIKGISGSKAGEEYLTIYEDSTRVNINMMNKGVPGSFAIGGISATDGVHDFVSFTPSNIYIGLGAGNANIEPTDNVVLGNFSGTLLNSMNATGNVFIGNRAGQLTEGAWYNVFIGTQAGQSNLTGTHNVFMGHTAGSANNSGNNNVFIGSYAGLSSISGSYNTYIGQEAGAQNKGNYNIFVGSHAGYYETNASERLYIGAGDRTSAMFYGELDNRYLRINSYTGIWGDPEIIYSLKVYGNAWATGNWLGSDIQFKNNIEDYQNALYVIKELQGVTYNWNVDEFPAYHFDDTKQIGFIAQDVEEVIPEIVKTGKDGYKAISYTSLIPVLVEAVKEQQTMIESLQQENDELKMQNDKIKAQIESLNSEICNIKSVLQD